MRSQSRTMACSVASVVAPVAAHRRGGAEPHLAHLAVGQRPGLVVADADLDAAAWPADGEQRLLLVGVEARCRCRTRRSRWTSSGSSRRRRSAPSPRAPSPAATRRRPSRSSARSRGRRPRGPRAAAAPSAGPRRRATGCGARRCRPSASAARHRPRMWVVIPSRRYHGSFVVKPDVGELRAGEHRRGLGGRVAPRVGDVDPGDGGELAVAEQRALRLAGRARREHEGHRPLRVVGQRCDRAPGGAAPRPGRRLVELERAAGRRR